MTELHDALHDMAEALNKVYHYPVLDHGYVELEDSMADDLMIVNNAKVSFAKSANSFGAAERGLLRFLMRERHGSPFEAPVFRYRVKCPIFVAREWMRHRVGSFNEVSGRYSELEREFYVPELEDIRTQVGKPGNYTFEQAEYQTATLAIEIIAESANTAFDAYEDMLDQGIAKEVARLVLPLNTYTEFIWTVNCRSLLNFLALRAAPTSQWEIRCYAEAVEEICKIRLPETHTAWDEFGRVAP